MGKRTNKITASVLVVLTYVLGSGIGLAQSCDNDTATITGGFGSANFSVEVAITPGEQAQGLMYRTSMAKMSGMIFEFPREKRTSFWMKNTPLPLDMIFADQTGQIVNIHENATPLDETPIFGGESIKFVLELNAGLVSLLGVSTGDHLSNPNNSEDLTWVCQ